MVEKKIDSLVKTMVEYNLINEEQKENYVYALTCFIEMSITVGSILLVSIFLRNFVPTVGFLLFFFSLRKRTGGYHLNTFGSCYVATLIIYGLVVFACPFIIMHMKSLVVFTSISCICVFILGTVNHPNIHMSKQELEGSKENARLVLTIEISLILFLIWIHADSMIIVYLSIAILLCAFLQIVAKFKGQEVKVDETNNQEGTWIGGKGDAN